MRLQAVALACALFALPAVADAATLAATPVYPGSSVVAGTPVSFGLEPAGFVGMPSYWVVDSFGGGANNTNLSYNAFFWKPNQSMVGSHTITITGTDAAGNTANVSQTITVLASPTVAVDATSSDVVGYPLAFAVSSAGFYGPVFSVSDSFRNTSMRPDAVSLGVLHWTPLSQDVGTHTITVAGSDQFGSATSTSFTIQILPVGGVQPPTAPSATASCSPAGAAPAPAAAPVSAPAAVFVSFLHVGSRGAEVSALQTQLAKLGFLHADATGYFGPLTKAAVAAYQSAHGISAVGYVGPATRASLNTGN